MRLPHHLKPHFDEFKAILRSTLRFYVKGFKENETEDQAFLSGDWDQIRFGPKASQNVYKEKEPSPFPLQANPLHRNNLLLIVPLLPR